MTRYVRFSLDRSIAPTVSDASPAICYGILDGQEIRETDGPAGRLTGKQFSLAEVRLLPPCSPTKIVCVGRNYREHAKELGNEVPSEPLIFLKPPSSLIASGDCIVYPKASQRLDFEGELGVIIGARARNVKAEDAMKFVLGYTCVNDVTARDLQKKDGQWTRGKGHDTFCPAGPCMVLASEMDLVSLRVVTRLDGVVKQNAPVTDMLFPLPDIIAYVSAFMTLEPGDLIATGTPPGVGPMSAGSTIEVDIEGVGLLANRVILSHTD